MSLLSVCIFSCIVSLASFIGGAAYGGGSLPLTDLMDLFGGEPDLIAEVVSATEREGLNTGDVISTGARFGRHWTHLGGERTVPFHCLIGHRQLVIDAESTYRDEAGSILTVEAGEIEQAVDVNFAYVVWRWETDLTNFPPSETSD